MTQSSTLQTIAAQLEDSLNLDETPEIFEQHNHTGHEIKITTVDEYDVAKDIKAQCDDIIGDGADVIYIRSSNAYPNSNLSDLYTVVAFVL